MKKIFMNNDWGFTRDFTEKLTKPDYKQELEKVRIPHTCAETPLHYFNEKIYQMVSGYRKEFDAKKEWAGKRVFLTFEGVGHACRVFLNGKLLGRHNCGYTAFTMEMSGKLDFDNKNILAVEVDSRESLNIPPFGNVIDYMTFGGIYRDVYIEVAEETFVEDVFVNTDIENEPAIKTNVTINGSNASKCHIRQYISKKDGEYVFLGEIPASTAKSIDGDNTRAVISTSFSVPKDDKIGKIQLWDIDSPNLYKVKTELTLNGKTVDEREDVFGFRTARFEKDGFYLNGKKVKIRGLNRHQSYPYIGYAAPKSLQINDADILKKELGVNAVRTSHYPQSQHFIQRCDELGLLVFTEIPGWQHIGDYEWKNQAVKNTEDMIMQYRNHPSIIIWGVRINESADDDEFYIKTNEVAHKLDATRATGGVRCIKKSHLYEDVYTYNDFVHEGNNKGCEPKAAVTPNAEKPYFITEHNGHMFPTKAYDNEEKRLEHALRHANVLDAVGSFEDIAGAFGWCMFDYNTHKDFGSGDRVCYHGVMDMFRNPKLAAALYASQQDETPVLAVSSSMDIGEHPGCVRGLVYIFTNADSVKMYKNDEFIHEYSREDTPYKNLPHGPIPVDDYVGDLLETKEGMKPSKARDVKKVLNAIARYGVNNHPIDIKLTSAKLFMNMDDAMVLYNKYVGDWGSSSTSYKFEAIKDGKVVKTVEKKTMDRLVLSASASTTELKEDTTYDMAAVRIYMNDELGNVMSFCNYPVELKATGKIELVGPNLISLQGGMTGTYIKTVGKAGKGKLTITASGADPVEIEFDVKVSKG